MTAALLDRATTVRQPAVGQPRRQPQPKLRVLDQAASRRRARHRSALLILFIAVLAGFFAVAFVHAELVAGQYELDAVRTEISQAEARHAELARAVEEASAPAVIVERATGLGMVRARQPVYLTAAAPVRAVEVSPSLATPAVMAPADTVDGTPSAQVAAAPPANTDRLRGTIGQAGGISAAVRIEAAPIVALGTDGSPIGATTATATASADNAGGTTSAQTAATARSAGPSVSAATVATTPAADATWSGPVSSVAGTRAVSTPAVTSAVAGATSAPPVTAASVGTNPAGGLASAAATTSG